MCMVVMMPTMFLHFCGVLGNLFIATEHEFMRETPFVRYEKLHRFTRLYVETIRVKTHLVIHANGNCAIDRNGKQT